MVVTLPYSTLCSDNTRFCLRSASASLSPAATSRQQKPKPQRFLTKLSFEFLPPRRVFWGSASKARELFSFFKISSSRIPAWIWFSSLLVKYSTLLKIQVVNFPIGTWQVFPKESPRKRSPTSFSYVFQRSPHFPAINPTPPSHLKSRLSSQTTFDHHLTYASKMRL